MADEIKENTPKRKIKRLPVVIAVVVVVAVIGVAGWAWHATPECCDTICHSTMGKYYDSFVNDSSSLAYQHASAVDNQCLGCHEATLPQMMHEVQVQLSGSYSEPFEKVTFSNDFCLQSGCHLGAGVMPGATESSTKDLSFDPHSTFHGGVSQQCNSCHLMHDQSVFTCAGCHYTYEKPEGWDQEVTVDGNTFYIPEGWTVPQQFEASTTAE